MELEITATGTRPLLMHNCQLANPFNEHAKLLSELNSKRKKTEEDRHEIARAEYMGGLYWSREAGPFIPDNVVRACIITGAKLDKLGTAVERAFLGFDQMDIPLRYDGPRDADALFENKNFVDQRPAGVQQAKVLRTRPKFSAWGFQVTMAFDETMLDLEDLQRVIVKAGKYAGVGDARRLGFGRFDAVSREV
jgi:hypothetical protein